MLGTTVLLKKVKTKSALGLLENVATKQKIGKFEETAGRLELIKLNRNAIQNYSAMLYPIRRNVRICDTHAPRLRGLIHKVPPTHILANSPKRMGFSTNLHKEARLELFGSELYQSCRIGSRCLSTNQYNIFQPLAYRFFHSGPSPLFTNKVESSENKPEPPTKPSSKVEVAVKAIEEKQKTAVTEPKRPILKRIQDELLHYYHGFRLLLIDIKISALLLWRILRGNTLSRREHRQLIRTTGDVFRLVPFSVFIIVPFMELLLPVFLKFFPGMLPSTFQTKNDKEEKMKAQLKVKLDMAKFLQQTLDDMAPQDKGRSSTLAKDFAQFIDKIRTSGTEVTNEEILKYSKLFEDEITLDSLSKPQLMALCRVLEIPAIGYTQLLRFQLKLKLRSLLADDKVIHKEGISHLTYQELQLACKSRGMRAVGVAEDRLKRQLEQWIQLSLHEKVPPSLLLLSRAMYLSENLADPAQLQATLSSLPDSAALRTKGAIGEREGRVDNKTRIEILKDEELKIKEERLEEKEIETVIDPPMSTLLTPETPMTVVSDVILKVLERKVPLPDLVAQPDGVTAADLGIIETAIDDLGSEQKKLYMEKEELEDLKEEIQEYSEDVEDLKSLAHKTGGAKITVKESKGARRLFKKLNAMISEIDGEIKATDATDETKANLVSNEDLMKAIQKFQTDPEKLNNISQLLVSLDEDKDGKVEVDDILKLVELIGRENITLNTKQIEEVVTLLNKEELLEVEAEKNKDKQKSVPNQDLQGPPQ